MQLTAFTKPAKWFGPGAPLVSGQGALGLLVGLVVGMNLSGVWPQIRLHATATEAVENFSVATGTVTAGTEALFFLDYLTGDLKAAVINPRPGGRNASPKFTNFYEYNISKDFTTGAGRAPKYLLITGAAEIPRGSAGFQLGNSVVYVVEANSGEAAAYAIPLNTSQFASGKPQLGTFVPLDKIKLRTTLVRE